MGHRIGDAVRLKVGSELRDLLAPYDDATGYVFAASPDGESIAVRYPAPVELYTGAVPASEFVTDRALDEAPF